MEKTYWVFTGSQIVDGQFMADTDGSIIATFRDPFAIINNPLPTGATRHYTLEENPGLGMQGLYYNYHTMAKALAVYGEEKIQVKGRKESVEWRKELLEKLIELQKWDGY